MTPLFLSWPRAKTDTGRCWIYVRDDNKPFGGAWPPAAIFYYSRDRRGEHPQTHLVGYTGILQADAYDGYNKLYLAERKPGPIQEAACWVHARRPFFAMADMEQNAHRKAAGKKDIPLSPIAIEIVRRIDALFAIERDINGKSPEERLSVRQSSSRPLVEALESYMREQLTKLSRGHDLAKAIQYMLKRWHALWLCAAVFHLPGRGERQRVRAARGQVVWAGALLPVPALLSSSARQPERRHVGSHVAPGQQDQATPGRRSRRHDALSTEAKGNVGQDLRAASQARFRRRDSRGRSRCASCQPPMARIR